MGSDLGRIVDLLLGVSRVDRNGRRDSMGADLYYMRDQINNTYMRKLERQVHIADLALKGIGAYAFGKGEGTISDAANAALKAMADIKKEPSPSL